MNISDLNRRRFIKQLGSVSVLNTLSHLRLANSVAADSLQEGDPPHRALVCLFLNGGQDSFNMLVPRGSEYVDYAIARSNLALGEETLLPLNQAPGGDGRLYGLNSQLTSFGDMFNGTGNFAGKRRLSFVANVGTLVEPVTRDEYLAGQRKVPASLFSHVDQIKHWQTSVPQGQSEITGWGGRAAECLRSTSNDPRVSMNISLAGVNHWQSAGNIQPFTITPEGAFTIARGANPNDPSQYFNVRRAALEGLVQRSYSHVLEEGLARKMDTSLVGQEFFQEAFVGNQLPTEVDGLFSGQPLARQFAAVARGLLAAEDLGQQRQTFFVNSGGWDHHTELLEIHGTKLQSTGQALASFQLALEALGLADRVLTLVISEFGRSMRSNGRGTDHGWGGNCIIMGKPINGGRVFGDFPNLTQENGLFGPQDVGLGGRFVPTTSTDEVFAESLRWFGIRDSSLPTVLPNLSRFWTPSDGSPVGYVA